jgi:hypothetical protein
VLNAEPDFIQRWYISYKQLYYICIPLTAAESYKQLNTVSLPCYGLDDGGMAIRSPAAATDFPSQKRPNRFGSTQPLIQ